MKGDLIVSVFGVPMSCSDPCRAASIRVDGSGMTVYRGDEMPLYTY